MKKYKGKVVLAVNVASQCGFTKQYQVQSQANAHDLLRCFPLKCSAHVPGAG